MVTVKYFDPNNGRIIEINHVGTVEYDNIPNKENDNKLYYLHDDVEYYSKDENLVIDDTDIVKDLFSNVVNLSEYTSFEEYIIAHQDITNAFLPEIDPQSALNFIKRYLLGEHWHDSFTGSQAQLNAEIVKAIKENYTPIVAPIEEIEEAEDTVNIDGVAEIVESEEEIKEEASKDICESCIIYPKSEEE